MASDASETLVLDQCALFALRCAVGAAQDREVSSHEIIGALRTAAKWALAQYCGECESGALPIYINVCTLLYIGKKRL